MPQMLPVAGTSPYVVTTDDGTLFHCQPHEVQEEGAERRQRWVFMDTKRVRYVGPAYEGQVAPQALQRMLSEWWGARERA